MTSCDQVFISLCSSLEMSSYNLKVLKTLSSLLGGERNLLFNSDVSAFLGIAGLQYSANCTYASSRLLSVTSLDGSSLSGDVFRKGCELLLDGL